MKAVPSPEADGGEGKGDFLKLASRLMRRFLIHHARPLRAQAVKVDLDDRFARLEGIGPRLRAVVELKGFDGMTLDEIANSLKCSTATVTRDWHCARHWLQREFGVREWK
jgi:DNA-directed RNA polymerase specialized sigma24 family protein